MYKNRTKDGRNNVCGQKIREIRKSMEQTTSQRQLAEMLQIAGLDLDKNAIQRIETGLRFVTDIELRVIASVLKVDYKELLGDDEPKAE